MSSISWIHSLTRTERWGNLHRLAVWLAQICVFSLSIIGAFLLRFEFTIPGFHRGHFVWALLIWIPAKLFTFRVLNLDRGWWRFVSIHDLVRLAYGNLLGSLLGAIIIFSFAPAGFPRSLYILDFLLCFLGTASKRAFTRVLLDSSLGGHSEGARGARIFIYGGGAAGLTLLREIRTNPKLGYTVCGFIDDNPQKRGIAIQGAKVLGAGDDLSALALRHKVSKILIALPSATGGEMTGILRRCHAAGLDCRTIPALAEIIEGNGLVNQIREVAVEDLLGRKPVHLDESGIRARIEGKVVAVTGAAGSIGSELCRQLARFHPAAILAYECAESALFYIDREMRENFPSVPFHPEIGDIRNPQRLAEVFERYHPNILFHAAAYKHVPMMEAHPFEAVENNVLGTWNVAVAASQHGIDDFVMISSDKAVRPTNVMGATKRVAELVINGLQNGGTNYVSVRFGNVLGSNGSVIPVFKQQIAARKPITVTDPEMRRYFMTIPEAAQLVLQASIMGDGGEIFVLDMGEPVRIVDLARNLILLSGLRPGEDIKIKFTGVRPGEKLYEELAHQDEETRPTTHAKIKIYANNCGHRTHSVQTHLAHLRRLCTERDLPGLILQLKDIVPDYNPSSHLLRRVVKQTQPPAISSGDMKSDNDFSYVIR